MSGAPVTQLPEVDVTASRLAAGTGLVLRIDGTDYGGWLSVRVRRNLEQAAAEFDCEVTERWPGKSTPWQILPGAACEVLLDGKLVVTGYVEVFAPSFDAHSHRVEVRGHSKTIDAYESSIEIDGGQLKGLTLQQVAERLLKPFGITVTNQAPTGEKLGDVQIQQGETPYALIERVCRMQGILVSDDEQGHLVLTRAGSGRAAGKLVQSESGKNGNILAASAELDDSSRFGTVTIKPQKRNLDDAADWPDTGDGNGSGDSGGGAVRKPVPESGPGDTGVSPSGSATDHGVTRHRPLIIYGENVSDAKEAQTRAEHEVARRLGLSKRARVTVQGWTQDDGSLWQTNTSVPIQAKWLGLDESLTIVAVEFIHDEGGTRTDLDLVLPASLMASDEEAAKAAKPASGDSKDTKAAFWAGAKQSGPADAADEEP